MALTRRNTPSLSEMINSRDELIISPASLSRKQRDYQFIPREDQLAAHPDGFADEIVRKRRVIINSSCEMIVLRCVLAILRDEIVRERGGIISSAFEMITCGKNVIAAGKKYLFTSNVDKSAARGSYE